MARNAKYIPVRGDLPFTAPAGHAMWLRDKKDHIIGIQFGCPCGCGKHYGASFNGPAWGHWAFDGNIESPTIVGSLDCDRGHWHGFLESGNFVER